MEIADIPRAKVKDFIKIEPAYALKLTDDKLSSLTSNKDGIPYMLNIILDQYIKIYGFEPGYVEGYGSDKDILTNPDTEVKRLLRCINQRQIKK